MNKFWRITVFLMFSVLCYLQLTTTVSAQVASGQPLICTPATGAPTRLQAQTGADADSGALTTNRLYRMNCDSDAWVDFGTAAVTATANDTLVPAGQEFYFRTSQTLLHVSALSRAVNGDCRITLCSTF